MDVIFDENFSLRGKNSTIIRNFSEKFPLEDLHKRSKSYIFLVIFNNVTFQVNFTTIKIHNKRNIKVTHNNYEKYVDKNPFASWQNAEKIRVSV
jgi:hypothetical protein